MRKAGRGQHEGRDNMEDMIIDAPGRVEDTGPDSMEETPLDSNMRQRTINVLPTKNDTIYHSSYRGVSRGVHAGKVVLKIIVSPLAATAKKRQSPAGNSATSVRRGRRWKC